MKFRFRRILNILLGVCFFFFMRILIVVFSPAPPLLVTPPAMRFVKSTTPAVWMPKVKPTLPNITDCQKDHLGVPDSMKSETCLDCQTTCQQMLFGSGTEAYYDSLKQYMAKHTRPARPDKDFIDMTANCDEFQRTQKYILQSVSEEEENFPIAFNILMHKEVEQVERLLRMLYRPQNSYCIHMDAKSPAVVQDAIRAIAACFDNVFIASKLERVVYAGFSRLQADVTCMKDHLNTGKKWNYLINTAAQAFPLRTNAELVKILKIYNGSNDVEGIWGRRIIRSRFDQEWLESEVDTANPKMTKSGKKNPKPPDDIEIVRGSAYAVFSRAFVDYIINDDKAKHLLEWSKKTYSPDEHYWATLHHTYYNPHLKTPGGFSGIPDEKPWLAVYAAWGGVDKCGGVWKHGSCVFGIKDLPLLMKRREHFANKFYIDHQTLALDCLEAWLLQKTYCPPQFDHSYYSELSFVKK